MIIPVILSGGSGTRLWPLSRELYPKQFLPLASEQTMLQSTLTRLNCLPGLAPPIIVCNEQHRFLVAEQLRVIHIQPRGILLEPVARNTAPAVAVAALHAISDGSDPLLLILPSDHFISDATALCRAITDVKDAASNGKLATFGIVPTTPETGYGYIKAASVGSGVVPVSRFVEKPDLYTAKAYVESGDYYWNSGMFLLKASNYLQNLKIFSPDIYDSSFKAFNASTRDSDFIRLDPEHFAACRSDSIDYAVMEKAEDVVVIPLDAGWSDVGSWSALWELGCKDAYGNVSHGDVTLVDTSNCYLHTESRLLAAIGVKNLVVVETSDAILVAHRERVQDVKEIVNQLKNGDRVETILHRKVHRPWGSYEGIDVEDRFQVKRITVNPGASLSLQLHHHRAEHWIVVKGTAQITCGDKEFILTENQSTYIPLGIPHRLVNPGKIPLELIEIQSGSYLGEDDIVRFEDNYGRT